MTRMRNQAAKQAFDVAAGDQQEDEEQDNRDNSDQLSSSRLSPLPSRGKRKQERANKSRPNEMTEEEMMDLALRLSEQEASIVAIKRQKEEEAMKKAIQESMSQQDQPCPPSESQSLLDETDAPSIICTRRKLTYSNGRSSSVSQEASGCTSEKIQKRGTKRSREESVMSLKRKRKEGSPLLEMPDLSQTQKIHSQISASSSRVLDLQLDSMQSSDSTQIQEFPLQKSPFFPSSYRKAEVRLSRLSQDPVHSGIVWSSQDSTPLRSLPAHCRSLTFPKSPKCSGEQVSRKSPVFSESSREDGGESTSENCRSPVFAGNSQSRTCPSPRRDPVLNCNSGLVLSSQESLTSVARTESCRSQSPVFPRSPAGLPATCQSPGFSDNCEGEAEDLLSRSPVFDGTDPLPQTRLEVQKHSMKEDGGAVPCHPVGLNQVSGTVKPALVLGRPGEELEDRSRNAEQQLSGNMTLLWSDEDEDLTQVDSPSPVFPEERLVQLAEEQPASLDPPGGSPGPSASTRSGEPPSEQEAASSSTVHYYWGVPFCPRGLHPDSYTQVILAQLEVYEKSLKQAQRRLLRKAEWGEAIIPQPEKSPQPTHHSPADSPQEDFTGRRVIRLRRKKLHDAGDAPAAAEEAEEEEEGGEEDGEQTQEGGQVDTDDCHVCPETQLSNVDEDRTQDVMVVDAAAQLLSKSPELLDVDMILGDDSPAADEQLEEADIDALLESNSEGGVSDRVQKEEEGVEPDMVRDPGETGDRGQLRSTSPELDLPVRGSSVDCPMCLRSFPMTEIEVHAAYCDGEDKSTSHQASLKPRRKRARKAGEDEVGESSSTAREKCYICQALVPVGGYGRHTELCIQQQEAKKENLLSALDKTESRASEARPSGSKVQPGYVIDLLNEEEEEEEGAVRISNSPIRSFTPISEATDCLIDFRRQQQQQQQQQQQRSRKLSRRRR